MIIGVGNDIIEIIRIAKACEKTGFVERYFTARERALFSERHNNIATIAGNFAAKEATAKMLGTGFRKMHMNEIEILRDPLGKPYVLLTGEAKRQADTLEINHIHLSISHNKTMASAVAIGEK